MDYMTRLMREAARDYRLDPKLSKECTADVSSCMSVSRRAGVTNREGGEGEIVGRGPLWAGTLGEEETGSG